MCVPFQQYYFLHARPVHQPTMCSVLVKDTNTSILCPNHHDRHYVIVIDLIYDISFSLQFGPRNEVVSIYARTQILAIRCVVGTNTIQICFKMGQYLYVWLAFCILIKVSIAGFLCTCMIYRYVCVVVTSTSTTSTMSRLLVRGFKVNEFYKKVTGYVCKTPIHF